MLSSTLLYIAICIFGGSIIVATFSALVAGIIESIKQKEVLYGIFLTISLILSVLALASIVLRTLGL